MITGINESINKNIIQIIGGIMINVSVKSLIYAKKIIFGILTHVFAKIENI